ncbi:MAG: IS66 family insertion sequence element accessory protein TnpB [bacterium]|nr:IS66 family insertion sequence element accessory protein TnpB [bacterium]
MILLPRSVKVYVATASTNLRNSFDGLSIATREVLKRDPLSGHIFVYINRRRNQVKLLVWTRGGFTIVHKRLEKGTFGALRSMEAGAVCVEFDVHELSMLLEGVTFVQSKASHRWEPPMHTSTA